MHARLHIHIQQASTEYKIEHGFILTLVHTYMSVYACTYACIHTQMQASLHGCNFRVDIKRYSIANNFMYTNLNTEKSSLVEHKFTYRLNSKGI